MGPQFDINACSRYLDHLDKQMTMEGVITAFCVGTAAALFDRVLAADVSHGGDVMKQLQGPAHAYMIGAAIALICAAAFFFLQREDLVWLHGEISMTVTREARGLSPFTDTWTVEEALNYGDSWSLWNRHKQGLVLLAAAAAEIALGLWAATWQTQPLIDHWELAWAPFVAALGGVIWISVTLSQRDEQEAVELTKPVGDLARARKARQAAKGSRA